MERVGADVGRPSEMELRREKTVASGANVVAGGWLLVSPLLIEYGTAGIVNAIAAGGVVAVLASIRTAGGLKTAGLSWINVAIGIWLVASPFALGASTAAHWNFLAVGAVVSMCAFVSATATPRFNAALARGALSRDARRALRPPLAR